VNGRFKTDNRLLRHRAVLGGAGVLLEPEFLAADDIDAGRLTRLMPDYTPVSATLEAVCPTHRAATPKVRSLVAFLMERLNA
jgi:DNA-binding transcriptional LysR family regulator